MLLRRPRATSLNSNLRTIGPDHTLDNEPSIDEGIASGLSRTISFLEKGQDVVDLGHCSVPLALQAFSLFVALDTYIYPCCVFTQSSALISVSTRNIIQPTLNEKMQPVYIELRD